jgi:hypothetical protein
MFIFLNLTLHSFGPDNFVPLVQIGIFQEGLIEENKSYKMVYYTVNMQLLLGKIKPHEFMNQPNIF